MKPMNLLVVDDEYYAVKGITQGIDWSDLPIGYVYEAMDVKLAKETMAERHIDILISDIEMPGENGLDLLEWVREHSPGTETIFLTGHANFAYAQKAVQLGSFDYVLKPIDHDLLKQIVGRAVAKVQSEKQFLDFHETYKVYSELWHRELPALVERFWQEVLAGRIPASPERLEMALQQYYLPLKSDSSATPILLSIEQWDQELSARDEEIMEYAVRKAAAELILQERPGIIVQDARGNSFAIVYDTTDDDPVQPLGGEELRQRCEQFIQACSRYFHCHVSCYIGAEQPLLSLGRSIETLLDMERDNIAQLGCVMTYSDAPAGINAGTGSGLGGLGLMQHLPAFADWSALLEIGKKDELLQRMDDFLQGLQREGVHSEALEAFYYGVLHMVYSTSHRKGLSVRDMKDGKPPGDGGAPRTVPQLRAWVCRLIVQAADYMSDRSRSVSAVTGKVQSYIAQHLHEELSREDIAASVYLNPAYLSRLFKKETGLSLSDYIVKQRIEKAKSMLIDGTCKISSIAEMTGYCHFSHFAKSFKKMVGMTPQQFRKQFQRAAE
jgi:two-component system response regulator YesN